jgi:carbonic anhydrase/acetyltransferase-like protein (isoleucine patch superfamily)
MLAAGAMLTPGKRIGARELWGGRPAKLMRALSDVEIAGNMLGVAHYVENGRAHRAAISG